MEKGASLFQIQARQSFGGNKTRLKQPGGAGNVRFTILVRSARLQPLAATKDLAQIFLNLAATLKKEGIFVAYPRRGMAYSG